MTLRTHRKLWMAAGAACLLAGLSACGGDDDTPVTPAATASVPASASASVDGYVSYLKALVASSADTLEPVDLSTVTPPKSDITEPTSVN